MPLSELLPIAGALSAPAFFLFFALASLGTPLLALACLFSAQLGSAAHPEAYARRLLRLGFSCALPALLVFAAATALSGYKAPWLFDWFRAAPLGPGLLLLAVLAFAASLLILRLSGRSHRSRHRLQNSPLGQTTILALLALSILWLSLMLAESLLAQAQAILQAATAGGIGVAPLIVPDATEFSPLSWTSLGTLAPLCAACAGAMSLEYLLVLRDREPFGRDAQAQMLRLGARSTLRAALLALAFLPALWLRLPAMPALQGGEIAAKVLLSAAAACGLALCLLAGILARDKRPWNRLLLIHACQLCVWLALTALLSVGLLCLYAV